MSAPIASPELLAAADAVRHLTAPLAEEARRRQAAARPCYPVRGPAFATSQGLATAYARRWLAQPVGKRPALTRYAEQHRLAGNTLFSAVTRERTLRADSVAWAHRQRIDQAAAYYLARVAPGRNTQAARRTFAQAHGFTTADFRHALARVLLDLRLPASAGPSIYPARAA